MKNKRSKLERKLDEVNHTMELIRTVIPAVVLVVQIMLGGWTSTNYAALACIDFPKCNTSWWPDMNFSGGFMVQFTSGLNYEFGRLDSPSRVAIHFSHRIWAILVTFMILVLSIISYKSA